MSVLTVTATTAVSNRPESPKWAYDTFNRHASVTRTGEVALSYCGGTTVTGHCYSYTGAIHDYGTFTTIPGQSSPGAGDLNGGSAPTIGVAATGGMWGWGTYRFYSDFKTIKASLMPATENDNYNVPGAPESTGAWVEQFFPATATFWTPDGSNTGQQGLYVLTNGGWHYTLGFGADAQCPNLASRWIDSGVAAPDGKTWGTSPVDGNILAPASGHC
ncbi:MAG: hypothetical protein ACYCO9_00965 [Streptosporangiaceae bacterium]